MMAGVSARANIKIFIQARMSSVRFPGKMLALLMGKPVLQHVVQNSANVVGKANVVVLTSTLASDDVLADYAKNQLGVKVFRGDLENVVKRFQDALVDFPCEWIIRICGDSPLIDGRLIRAMILEIREDCDLLSNVVVRTFPRGQSIEILKASTLKLIDSGQLSRDQKEHLTSFYYANLGRFRINSIRLKTKNLSEISMVVDTVNDLVSLEKNIIANKRILRKLYEGIESE